MKIHNVHARDLAVPRQRVGELLDRLGGPDDRLWPPVERWPADQLELERPLAVGGRARHDGISY